MRTIKFITTVCWVVTALVLAGLALWFLTGSMFGIKLGGINSGFSAGFSFSGIESLTGPFVEAGTYSVPPGGIKSLDIDWVSGEITVVPYDGNEIKFTEYAQRELQEDEKVKFEISGNTLRIKYLDGQSWVRIVTKKLEVFIPTELSQNFDSLIVDSASADIRVEGMITSDMKLDSVSGAIRLSEITAIKLSSDTASGSIDYAYVSADTMRVNSVSGSVKMNNCTAKKLKTDSTSGDNIISGSFEDISIDTISGKSVLDNSHSGSIVSVDSTSGDMELSGSFHSMDLDTMSGKITVVSSMVPIKFDSDTTSGDVKLTIPNEGTVSVNHSAASGKLTSDIPVTMVNRGSAQLRFSSISGNVRIMES